MKKSKTVFVFSLILIFFNLLFYSFQIGGENILTIVSDFLPVICSIIACIGLNTAFRSFKTFDYTKISWLMLLLGIVLFFGGESTYAVLEVIFEVDMNETFPTLADYFWLAGYLPLFIGLAMTIYAYKRSGFPFGNVKMYSLISAIFVIITGGLIYLLLIPIIQDTETSFLEKFVYLFYPIGDLFLIIPAVFMIYITSLFGKGSISRPWKYIAAGFISMTIADILYSYLSWLDMYGAGNFIDVAWNIGYLLIGIGAFYQKELIESL
ncbi:MAG: hypothetical protein AB1610_01060 [Nitrospirota bacterium]